MTDEVSDDPDTPRASWDLRTVIRIAIVVAVTTLALLGWLGHGRHVIHVRPGGAVFDDQILPVFFLVFLASALVAIRWPLVGGIVAAFGVAGMAPFAITQLEPWSAALVLVVFGLPAVAWIWLGVGAPPLRNGDTGPRITRRQAITTVGGLLIAVVGGAWLGRYVYDRIWGPTHPESDTEALPSSVISWHWCGAMTATSCVVRARPRDEFTSARLLVSARGAGDDSPTDPVVVSMANVYDRVIEFDVADLRPDTEYAYEIEVDNVVDTVRTGSFRTFPETRRSLRLVFASCARIGSNGTVFDAVRAEQPDLYTCLGDFHYGDNFVDDVDDYRQVFDVQLTRPAQAALYATVPIAYVWDDHDYGPNDSDKNAPGRPAAMLAYREYVPHYELAGPDTAIHQAFSIGTVRVILTDARSSRDPQDVPDDDAKSLLGDEQRDWLLDELVTSAGSHDLVIWVNPVPWVADAEEGGDSWSGYTTERALIANHIADNGIDNLLMVSGDAHMVAIDDGSHTNYSSSPGPGFPLLHVAALDRPGSEKGGPYTHGPIAGGGQFAVVDIADSDNRLDVTLRAMNWRSETLLRHEFAVDTRV